MKCVDSVPSIRQEAEGQGVKRPGTQATFFGVRSQLPTTVLA